MYKCWMTKTFKFPKPTSQQPHSNHENLGKPDRTCDGEGKKLCQFHRRLVSRNFASRKEHIFFFFERKYQRHSQKAKLAMKIVISSCLKCLTVQLASFENFLKFWPLYGGLRQLVKNRGDQRMEDFHHSVAIIHTRISGFESFLLSKQVDRADLNYDLCGHHT